MFINAFHPAYVQTYMPEFLSTIRSESAAKANGEKFGKVGRATRENLVGDLKPLNKFPTTKRVSLAPTEFHIFQKAGMPKGVK